MIGPNRRNQLIAILLNLSESVVRHLPHSSDKNLIAIVEHKRKCFVSSCSTAVLVEQVLTIVPAIVLS